MKSIKTSTAGPRSGRGRKLLGKAAFALATLAWAFGLAAWIVGFNPFAGKQDFTPAKMASSLSFDDRFGSGPPVNSPLMRYPSRPVVRSLRSDFAAEFESIEGLLAGRLRGSDTEQPSSSAVAAVPLPRSRPLEANLASKSDANASLALRSEPPPAQADNRTLLQKLADLVPPAKFTLASLEPNGGLLGRGPDLAALGYDNQTAVYDISARAVFLPSGGKLEAHSGLGPLMDDLGHVNERNVGATPPNVYELKPRERLFHGVSALRMTPVGENDTFGRDGLLVHSYMLGPNGDSNGCVSIKDYGRFLAAYRNGEINRLVVVPSLSEGLPAATRRAT